MPRRIAVLDRDLCTREKCGYICINMCPINRMGKECIRIDSEGYPLISEELCIGCGICVKKCPVGALSVVNLERDPGQLIHSYGENSFKFFNLPLPVASSVVGFLGKNGLGKTTAIKILSKQLIPNFGARISDWKDVEQRLSPQAKEYFKHVSQGKVAVKPQYIEILREYDMTVSQLLDKFAPSIKQRFVGLLNRKLSVLSGGELQKLAIEIAKSREADLYFFDEITNFLDIRERLSTAVSLREFAVGKNVIVVDHDLTIFDYLVDYIYVFLGEEEVYGFSSSLKAARTGINEYLSGYLRAENLRFRNYEIKFSTFSEEEKPGKVAFRYNRKSIKLGEFSLSIDSGEIRESEVIGILGPNGIGKTTFIRYLAGEFGDDFGIKVAYKRQYIARSASALAELLNRLDATRFEFVRQALDLKNRIINKRMDRLSGGQLQKVAIAYTLSLDADVYLLDEPTAYLDIEARLRLAKMLREYVDEFKVPVFVVDHDLIFLDSVANRVIHFTGVPGKEGFAGKPVEKITGLNAFLRGLDITVRRDRDSGRPRINKPGSVLDREQRESGNYFG